jgi:hypothetical protein
MSAPAKASPRGFSSSLDATMTTARNSTSDTKQQAMSFRKDMTRGAWNMGWAAVFAANAARGAGNARCVKIYYSDSRSNETRISCQFGFWPSLDSHIAVNELSPRYTRRPSGWRLGKTLGKRKITEGHKSLACPIQSRDALPRNTDNEKIIFVFVLQSSANDRRAQSDLSTLAVYWKAQAEVKSKALRSRCALEGDLPIWWQLVANFFATDCQELAIFPGAENASISFIDAVGRAISPQKEEGWPTGLEPATARTTIWSSTIELRSPTWEGSQFS